MTTLRTLTIDARRFDSAIAPLLRRQIEAAWEAGASTVALDLRGVVYIDSLGISALISEQRRRPPGTRIVLCSVGDYVRDVLEVTQLFRVFDVFTSPDEVAVALGIRA